MSARTGGIRIGSGLDVHPFDGGADRPLVLAGVLVPDGPPLAGHSDADVATHAVTDALLGALALGDLGSWFGVDRPGVADADSIGLLEVVVDRVHGEGWVVGNLDLTIVAQRPRLAAHRDTMRERLAAAVAVAEDAVSVKFTTTDHLGSIGRGEGIAAWATVLVQVAPD
ncbi:MAG: 2-C-methyl-D-erythritol 2,4-cyclodiphosphate synthase [Nitriliruptor sp.]|uniref:2-C-methyl-D-erythritol 2,4-cyclodiphosphate synthase n=1 Tax=Nitriliruptor sp. TaxID=2448056 RepID=UPI00349FE29F